MNNIRKPLHPPRLLCEKLWHIHVVRPTILALELCCQVLYQWEKTCDCRSSDVPRL